MQSTFVIGGKGPVFNELASTVRPRLRKQVAMRIKTQVLDLETMQFEAGPTMQRARFCGATRLDADRVLVIGGHDRVLVIGGQDFPIALATEILCYAEK